MENSAPTSCFPQPRTDASDHKSLFKIPDQKTLPEAPAIDHLVHASPDLPPPLAVLSERNGEKNVVVGGNKMVSPVLLKLRRNQERRVTPANPMNPVQVPSKKVSGFPAADRYMSPTDSLMSPISRGLLARSRRAVRPTPAYVPPKVLESTFLDADIPDSAS